MQPVLVRNLGGGLDGFFVLLGSIVKLLHSGDGANSNLQLLQTCREAGKEDANDIRKDY